MPPTNIAFFMLGAVIFCGGLLYIGLATEGERKSIQVAIVLVLFGAAFLAYNARGAAVNVVAHKILANSESIDIPQENGAIEIITRITFKNGYAWKMEKIR